MSWPSDSVIQLNRNFALGRYIKTSIEKEKSKREIMR